jgi:hypothetical protein
MIACLYCLALHQLIRARRAQRVRHNILLESFYLCACQLFTAAHHTAQQLSDPCTTTSILSVLQPRSFMAVLCPLLLPHPPPPLLPFCHRRASCNSIPPLLQSRVRGSRQI